MLAHDINYDQICYIKILNEKNLKNAKVYEKKMVSLKSELYYKPGRFCDQTS